MRVRVIAALLAVLAVACSRRRDQPSITKTHDDENPITSPSAAPPIDPNTTTFEDAHYTVTLPGKWKEQSPSTTMPATSSMHTYISDGDPAKLEQVMAYSMDLTAAASIYPTMLKTYGVDLSRDWNRKTIRDAFHMAMPGDSVEGCVIGGHGIMMMFIYTAITSGHIQHPDALGKIVPK